MSAPHPRLRKLAVLVAIITSFGVGIPTSASASTTASATSVSTATALPPATASAHSTTQPKNRVRDFCFGTADRASGNHGLSRQQHSENYDASAPLASGSPLATKGGVQGPKLLNAVPKSVLNTANHIFGPKALAKHKLGPVLESLGGDAVAATYRLQNAAQALVNRGAIKGVFDTVVNVGGHNVTIRGAVIDGVANLRTAFVP